MTDAGPFLTIRPTPGRALIWQARFSRIKTAFSTAWEKAMAKLSYFRFRFMDGRQDMEMAGDCLASAISKLQLSEDDIKRIWTVNEIVLPRRDYAA